MTTDTITITGLDKGQVAMTPADLDDLRSRLDGSVLLPGDEGWDDAVLIWNAMVAKEPARSSCSRRRPATSQPPIEFARDHGLLLSIKGGGHNIAGTSIAEGGLTLDMSRMRDVTVDAEARLAHVGPGCQLGDVDRATQEHGLATVLGFISEVGVAGLTLGGGLGYLTRRFGWTVDNLEEVEIVTADGQIRTASRDENADLFWASAAPAANLGVVTRFTFRLHEVGPTVYGGLIAWPFERADEILRAYRTLTTEAPARAGGLADPASTPRRRRSCRRRGTAGRSAPWPSATAATSPASTQALAPIRALGEPVVDLLAGAALYRSCSPTSTTTEPKGMRLLLEDRVPRGAERRPAVDRDRPRSPTSPFPECEIGFLHLGGALNEHDEDDGAVGNRDARFAIGVMAMWDPDEPDADRFRAVGPRRMAADPAVLDRPHLHQLPDRRRGRGSASGRRTGTTSHVSWRSRTPTTRSNLFRVNRNIPLSA